LKDESGRLHMSRQTTGCVVFCPSSRSSFAEVFAECPDWCSVGSCLGDVRPDMPVKLREVSGAESEEEEEKEEKRTTGRPITKRRTQTANRKTHAPSQTATRNTQHARTVTNRLTKRKTQNTYRNAQPGAKVYGHRQQERAKKEFLLCNLTCSSHRKGLRAKQSPFSDTGFFG